MTAAATVTTQITIRESQGYLTGAPSEALEDLIEATSFRPVGYQYTTLFKRGKSDGRVKLLKHSKFPAGLLGRVTDTLKRLDIPYTLDVEQGLGAKPDIALRVVGIESRPYQDDVVEKALLNPRGVIRAPTGSGKTAMGARIIVARGKYALVVVPTIDLLHQYRRFLDTHLRYAGRDDWSDIEIGQLGDGVVDPQPVTVATVRTAAKAVGVAYESYEYAEYDDKDDIFTVAIGGRDGRYPVVLAHLIQRPQTIFADTGAPDMPRAFDIVDAEGTQTIIMLHDPAVWSGAPTL